MMLVIQGPTYAHCSFDQVKITLLHYHHLAIIPVHPYPFHPPFIQHTHDAEKIDETREAFRMRFRRSYVKDEGELRDVPAEQ